MKKFSKRVLSLVLMLSLILTFLPFNGMKSVATQETEEEINYNATNALGEVLADAMESETNENSGYFVQNVRVEGFVANAKISAPDGATLVVAIYDEESGEMVTSGRTSVNSINEIAKVILSECKMPEYFIVRAFLLDSDNAPICQNYEGFSYTAAYQEFLSKTTEDFDEDKVINLDSSEESNFAVVSDETVTVEQTLGNNTIVKNDYENGIYTFKNPDDELKSLKVGDVLYFVYGDGYEDYILTKIANIDVKGDEITFIADENVEIVDLFSYIKIDTSKAVDEELVVSSAHYDDDSGDMDDYSKEHSIKIEKEYKKYKDDSNSNIKNNIYIKFAGELKVKFHLKFYYDYNLFKEDYYELSQTTEVTFTADTTLEAEAKVELEPLELFHGGIPVYAGLEAEVLFLVKITISASVNVKGGIEIKMVNGSKKISGKPDQDLSKKPSIELRFEVEGKAEFSFTPSLSVGLKVLKVFKISLSAEAKFFITAIAKSEATNDIDSFSDVCHTCALCIDGDIYIEVSGKIKFEFGINKKKLKPIAELNLFTMKRKLGDFYISFISLDDGNFSFVDFGLGECPFYEYKVTFNVIDENKKSLENVKISDGVNVIETDSKGNAYCYYEDGTYAYMAELDGYEINTDLMTFDKLVFVVNGETVTVNIYMRKTEGSGDVDIPIDPDIPTEPSNPESSNDSGVLNSGTCGENLTWVLYNDGELVIYGAGKMEDGDEKTWKSRKIKSIIICDGVTSIGDDAFSDCENLTNITIPDSVTSIGDDAFSDCENLTNITIPDSVTSIGSWAFDRCTSLTKVTISKNITIIDYATFGRCSSLTNVIIPYGVTTIKGGAFEGCSSLTNIIIPNSVISIGGGAFYGCSSLTDVIIPENVTKIEDSTFYDCDSLTNITIPDNITSIGNYAFYDCDSLTNVSIGNSLTFIGFYAFYDCDSLQTIIMPNTMKTICENAFGSCDNITTVYYTGTEEEWCAISFQSLNSGLLSANIIYNYTVPTKCVSGSSLNTAALSGVVQEQKIINNTVEGYYYVIMAVKNKNTNDLLSNDNLMFIDQKIAESTLVNFNIVLPESIKSYDLIITTNAVDKPELFSIRTPSTTTISYGDSIILHADISSLQTNSYDIATCSTNICPRCGECFEDETEYNSHLNYCSSKICPLCGQVFTDEEEYNDHIAYCDGESDKQQSEQPIALPNGWHIEWTASNGNFSYSVSDDGTTCTITPSSSGDTTFTATVYDEDGNVVGYDTQTMTSKAGFFDKIIAFFKKLFGLTKTIPQIYKGIF